MTVDSDTATVGGRREGSGKWKRRVSHGLQSVTAPTGPKADVAPTSFSTAEPLASEACEIVSGGAPERAAGHETARMGNECTNCAEERHLLCLCPAETFVRSPIDALCLAADRGQPGC